MIIQNTIHKQNDQQAATHSPAAPGKYFIFLYKKKVCILSLFSSRMPQNGETIEISLPIYNFIFTPNHQLHIHKSQKNRWATEFD